MRSPLTPTLGGSWAFRALLIPCSPCFQGQVAQSGPGVGLGLLVSGAQDYFIHTPFIHSSPLAQPTAPVHSARVIGGPEGTPFLSLAARPGGVPRSAGSPPARLGVPVVLDGQPQLAPVQGAAHAQAQLQVLIAQTQQHLFPREGGLGDGHPRPPRTAER